MVTVPVAVPSSVMSVTPLAISTAPACAVIVVPTRISTELAERSTLVPAVISASIFSTAAVSNETSPEAETVVAACVKMGSSKTGALIVLERNNNLDFLLSTGDEMNIKVTQPILESIFFKNSPLHDGAIIIANNIIKATRVILPVNNEKNIPERFGLRHRAAIGITEKTDALAVVVSEETGQISYIKNGEFIMYKNSEELANKIKEDLS